MTRFSHPAQAARVMVVDDDREVIAFVKRSLELAGYPPVIGIHDPILAADVARCERPDLILLDAAMPGIAGVDVLRSLRLAPSTASIPVLVLAGVNDSQAKRVAAEMGVLDFLVKPLDPLDLVAKVRSSSLIGMLRFKPIAAA